MSQFFYCSRQVNLITGKKLYRRNLTNGWLYFYDLWLFSFQLYTSVYVDGNNNITLEPISYL